MKVRSMLLYAVLLVAASVPLTGMAVEDSAKAAPMPDMTASIASGMSSGEVKKVDKDAGKITIKHGPLANLDMPAMTMVFRVKDAAMLDQVKQGEQIHFVAEKANGALTVMKLEAMQ